MSLSYWTVATIITVGTHFSLLLYSYIQYGNAAIHLSAEEGHADVVTAFLNRGMDVDVIGNVSSLCALITMYCAFGFSILHESNSLLLVVW